MIDPYVYGLIAIIALTGITALFRRADRWQLLRTVGAISLCWLIGYAHAQSTMNYQSWQFNILLDTLTALAIMWRPASNWQGYIGALYCLQIAMHIGYGIRQLAGGPTDDVQYYDWITAVAWLQLAVAGGWSGGIWRRSVVGRWRGHRAAGSHRYNAKDTGEAG